MLTIVILVPSGSATNPWTPALELHPRTMLWGLGNTAVGLFLLGNRSSWGSRTSNQPELLP